MGTGGAPLWAGPPYETDYLSTAQVAGGLGSNLAFPYPIDAFDHLPFSAGRDLAFGDTTFTAYLAFERLI